MVAVTTVAILSPGEMGAAVAVRYRLASVRTVTSLDGRSEASSRRAREAGIEALPSLEDAVRQSDAVISLVTPFGAVPLAREVAQAMGSTGKRPLYVDGNAIGPATADEVASIIGDGFVDGCIIGTADELGDKATFYLSGGRASEAAAIIRPAVRTEILNGSASAFKMLYAGLTKTLSATGAELLAAAGRLGLSEAIFAKYEADHPSVAQFFRHVLPGLPPRAARRSQEMRELASMLEELGLSAHMAHGAEPALAEIARRYGGNPEAWQRLLGPAAAQPLAVSAG